MKKILICIIAACWQLYGCENSKFTIIETIQEFPPLIKKLPPEKTVLFFDIDETIGYLTGKTGDIIKDFELVEKDTPAIIKKAQESYKCCALTSRSKRDHAITKAQLGKLGVDFSASTPFSSLDFDKQFNDIGHEEGVVYTYGSEKGVVSISYLHCCPLLRYVACLENKDKNLYKMINAYQTWDAQQKIRIIKFQAIWYPHYAKVTSKNPDNFKSIQSTTQGMENS